MLGKLAALDRGFAATRPAWAWLGQLAIVVLGVHLAADRLDDQIEALLVTAPLPWPTPDLPHTIAVWGAVVLELAVVLRAAGALLLTNLDPTLSWREWWAQRSVEAVVLPLFWAPVAVAGAWSLGMAVEDGLWAFDPRVARAAAWVVGVGAALRLGYPGWKRVVGGLGAPKRRSDGILWAPALLLVAGTAFWHGLPIWGWR